MKRFFSALFSTLVFVFANSQTPHAPVRLRCDFLLHTDQVSKAGMKINESLADVVNQKKDYQFPVIYSGNPVFNWQVDSSVRSISAYRIFVASSAALLNTDKPDLWDSKKTASALSKAIYNGLPLSPGKVYYWKVQVWNDKKLATKFSNTASFFYDQPDDANQFSHYPLTGEIQQAAEIFKNADGSWFLDFGKDGFGQLQLHLTSNKDDTIWIEAAEALQSPGTILRSTGNIRYIKKGLYLKKGTHDYTIEWPVNEKRNSRNPIQMPGYIGEVFPFRYVTISNYSENLGKESVKRKIIFYPFDESASEFMSSDTVLNQVWDLCRYSIKATSFMGYYVDGDRERVPYEADALINQLSHYAVDAEYSMARRSMAYVMFHPTWPTEWSLQNVSLAWYDYLYTGDDSYLTKYYSELQKKILMPLAAPNGLISTLTGKQTDEFLNSIHITKDFDGKHGLKDIVDWPQTGNYIGREKEYAGETDGFVFCNYNAVINAWYYESLDIMRKIAGILGKTSDSVMYAQKQRQVFQSFNKIFRDPKSGLIKDGDTTSHTSLHANMFALAFGLIPESDIPAVAAFIKTRKMACSVYASQFLLDALYNAGEDNYALELLTATTQRSWYNMIRVGSTISMEAWDKVYKPNLDLNHAWGSAPANIIVRKLMGVEPLTAGAETIRIKPQLGSLQFANLTTSILKGIVKVSVRKSAGADEMEISIPGATTADVYMASNPAKTKLIIDGKTSSIKANNGFYKIEKVQPGVHVFKLE